jgi:CRP-like cAMP-binding protein
LLLNLEVQQHFGLRAEQYQVFMLIVLATAQRLVRDTEVDESLLARTPFPRQAASSISRLRIAEIPDISVETVRRRVADLLDRGMVVEHRRGCLSTSWGRLERLAEIALPERVSTSVLQKATSW